MFLHIIINNSKLYNFLTEYNSEYKLSQITFV